MYGIDAANSKYSCIWCKCSKTDRHSLELHWSIVDEEDKGARTIESITEIVTGKTKNHFNVSHVPLFPSIPMYHVILDILYLFLRITDILINLCNFIIKS